MDMLPPLLPGCTLAQAAVAYGIRGLAVLPCEPRGKRPHKSLAPNGVYSATTDVETIRSWWSRVPKANIGIALGAPSGGLVVLDVDDREVAARVTALAQQRGWPTARTPSGGAHIYLVCGKGTRTTVLRSGGRTVGEIRGDGAYVLAPPSVVDGVRYERVVQGELPHVEDAARWAAEVLQECGVQVDDNGPQRWGAVNGSIPEGTRNVTLTSLAGTLRRRGLSGEDIAAALQAINARKCSPPLPEAEVTRIAASVARYPVRDELRSKLDSAPTDYRHGQVVGEVLRGRACYVPELGWLIWDGRRWDRDPDGDRVVVMSAEVLRDHYVTLARATDDLDQQRLFLVTAAKCLSRAKVAAAVSFARALLQERQEAFDQAAVLLNTQNGVVDLRTGQLLSHDPGLRFTKITRAAYNPAATAPRWEQFLNEIFGGDQELVRYVQRLFGYALLGDNRERLFVLCWGSGANGKTVFIEAIAYALGEYALETPPETFLALSGDEVRPRNDLARLRGVRLVTAAETREGAQVDPAVVKRITGGDRVPARFLYKEFHEFTPQFLPVLRTNHLPRVRGDDRAFWDRIRLLPFRIRIPRSRQDRQLLEKLRGEAEGILAWLVAGCVAYLRDGLQEPEAVRQATVAYRQEVDPVWRFLVEATEAQGQVGAAELYAAYRDWCAQEDLEPVSQHRFGRALVNLGYRRAKDPGGRTVYLGLGLRPPRGDPGPDTEVTEVFPTPKKFSERSSGEFSQKTSVRSVTSAASATRGPDPDPGQGLEVDAPVPPVATAGEEPPPPDAAGAVPPPDLHLLPRELDLDPGEETTTQAPTSTPDLDGPLALPLGRRALQARVDTGQASSARPGGACWCCGGPSENGGLCPACADGTKPDQDGPDGPRPQAEPPAEDSEPEPPGAEGGLPWPLELAVDVPAREPTDRIGLAQAAAVLLTPARVAARSCVRAPEDPEAIRARRRKQGLCEGCGGPVAVLGGKPTCGRCGWRGTAPSRQREEAREIPR